MKKVFTILITFLLALSLIGVASAADDPVINDYDPSKYEQIADAGSDVDVHYSVGQEVIVLIPNDVEFTEGVLHIHDNLTVVKSHIENGKFLNVYVKSNFNWNMMLIKSTSGGSVEYDDDHIVYNMRYDSNKDGVVTDSDELINRNADVDSDGYDDPVCILSLEAGVIKHRLAMGFVIKSQNFEKTGKFADTLKFTFSIEDIRGNGCVVLDNENIGFN